MKKIILFLLMLVAFGSCTQRRTSDVDVSGIDIPPTRILRYDLDLFAAGQGNLSSDIMKLAPKYRLFLGDDPAAPEKLATLKEYLENPRNQDFYKAVRSAYPELSSLESSLDEAFRHLKYYMPAFMPPMVYAYISGGDYEYPVQFNDSVLLIGLDNYLGEGYQPYRADGVPMYRIQRMDRDHVVTDCARLIATSLFALETGGGSLLDVMVEAGKRLYLLDLILPSTPPAVKIGYNSVQYEWIRKNESHVWAAIIENRMLYSNDGRVIRVFMSDGPFTAEFSKESPPLLGSWIGWRIVKQYMERNPEVTLRELLVEKDSQKILSGSKYKPEK
jgi:hypothetical protein